MQPVRSSNIPLRWSGETIPLPSVYKHVAPIGANHFPLCVFKVAVPSLHRFEVDDSNKVRRIRRDPTHYSRLSREGLNLATDCAQLFEASVQLTLLHHPDVMEDQSRFLSGKPESTTAKHERQCAGGWKPPSVGQRRPSSCFNLS